MKYILFVLLMGGDGMVESGWLPFDSEAQCTIAKAKRLQNLHMTDGAPAVRWVVECHPLEM